MIAYMYFDFRSDPKQGEIYLTSGLFWEEICFLPGISNNGGKLANFACYI